MIIRDFAYLRIYFVLDIYLIMYFVFFYGTKMVIAQYYVGFAEAF
jgi:hypothetical protein